MNKHKKPTRRNFIDIEGQKFGRLLVVEYRGMAQPTRVKKKSHKWLCRCDCGNEREIIGEHLRTGNTTSCGCLSNLRPLEKIANIRKGNKQLIIDKPIIFNNIFSRINP